MNKGKIKTGSMRKRITIKGITQTQTNTGLTSSYTTKKTVWGKVKPISASRAEEYGLQAGNYNYEVMMRYYSGLSKQDQFIIDGNTHKIKSLLMDDNMIGMVQRLTIWRKG